MFKNDEIDIDKVIQRLKQNSKNKQILTQQEIRTVCLKAREVFLSQPMFLQLSAPIKVCGDIHGQFPDLLNIFQTGGIPGQQNYLFIGDYVDRGKQSIECIILLFAYKIKFPQNFFLLRGNHECSSINRLYGFYDECKRKYNLKLWKLFSDVFNTMPVCALVEQKIICMHGGLSPQFQNYDQLLSLPRPIQIPDQGLLCDILWSDPQKDMTGWGQNQRGISYIFGSDVVQSFLKKHDLDLVCRAHQVVEEGYQFFSKRQLVTIFSAPNYCGQFQNNGAIMNIDESLLCSFQILPGLMNKKKK